MARQLEPALHIDSCASSVQGLAPFVPAIAAVRTPANVEACDSLAMAPHITAIDNLAKYFQVPVAGGAGGEAKRAIGVRGQEGGVQPGVSPGALGQ